MTKNIFAWILARFMESVHVKLTNEAVDVPVPEIFGEDLILKLFNFFDCKLSAIGQPVNDRLIVFILENLKAFLYKVCH
jgi:hypothetical protein